MTINSNAYSFNSLGSYLWSNLFTLISGGWSHFFILLISIVFICALIGFLVRSAFIVATVAFWLLLFCAIFTGHYPDRFKAYIEPVVHFVESITSSLVGNNQINSNTLPNISLKAPEIIKPQLVVPSTPEVKQDTPLKFKESSDNIETKSIGEAGEAFKFKEEVKPENNDKTVQTKQPNFLEAIKSFFK